MLEDIGSVTVCGRNDVAACPVFQQRETIMKLRYVITCLLTLSLIAAAPMVLHADMLGTSQLLTQSERDARVELVESYMDRDEVRSQMEAMGVDPALAVERVAGLTDSQLQQLALNIENAPAGGALGVILTVLLILLLLEILGVINIFNRV